MPAMLHPLVDSNLLCSQCKCTCAGAITAQTRGSTHIDHVRLPVFSRSFCGMRTRQTSSDTISAGRFAKRLRMLEMSASPASLSSSLEMRRGTAAPKAILCASQLLAPALLASHTWPLRPKT